MLKRHSGICVNMIDEAQHNIFSDHSWVKCVMDFNFHYVSNNTGDNEPNSKPASGKPSVKQIGPALSLIQSSASR